MRRGAEVLTLRLIHYCGSGKVGKRQRVHSQEALALHSVGNLVSLEDLYALTFPNSLSKTAALISHLNSLALLVLHIHQPRVRLLLPLCLDKDHIIHDGCLDLPGILHYVCL